MVKRELTDRTCCSVNGSNSIELRLREKLFAFLASALSKKACFSEQGWCKENFFDPQMVREMSEGKTVGKRTFP
jgi:hypothetical protein